MAVKIRLKRMGKIRAPFYRVVVMDSRTKRDGRAIDEIGKYHPTENPSVIQIDSERAQYWLGQGAQPTEPVLNLLKITGDWQKFKGLPGAEGTLQVAEAKPSKKSLYEAAVAAAGGPTDDTSGATTAKKKAAKKAPAKADTKSAGDETPAETVSVDLVETDGESMLETVVVSSEGTLVEDTEAPLPESAAEAAETLVAADAAPALPVGAVAPLADGSAPEGYTVKGNADSGKYHEEGGRWYDQTVAEMWFKTAADAEAAGFTKAGS